VVETEQTVYKWRHRDSVHDCSHNPHRLQTALTPPQEAVAVVLRTTLLVSIDDLLAVVRAFLNPDVSRSASIAACGGMGWAIFVTCRRKLPVPRTRCSQPASPATCMSM
jgi:hypothetical protein